MGTLVTLADGRQIALRSGFEGIVRVVAEALDGVGIADADGHAVPKGFLRWTDIDGRVVVVNATQIVAIEPPRSPAQLVSVG